MLRFTAEISGDIQLDRAFNRVNEHISDFRNFWPGVIDTFYEIESSQFESEGSTGASGKWTPLSPAYAGWKELHYPGEKILQREHALIDSMTSPDALDSILRPEVDELVIGSALPYALFQHRLRPVISLTEPNKRDIVKSIQRRLVNFTRSAGFEVREEAA